MNNSYFDNQERYKTIKPNTNSIKRIQPSAEKLMNIGKDQDTSLSELIK